ncbi:hypothetical protein M409DRAFT_28344 [Zasmidium cellare ATCC 36951]|uniref:SigF-like NTF2-like domain-containing protein n=1 Tax=Zasmidium cellare ATCC 36951 TaxID=1080233 RepID=A0A6A6C2F8_ZASCE|nr:uncharacterized protein M409DRAFT_28344 [Zasmidium cellare ATCC 36951]KAF2161307.1 hypothetical protein M409DRAFT_28344 [Zasmidium cellare ATCC 36951]
MDDPIQDITSVVHRLTQGSPKEQEETINEYFTTNASFTHPFCRTGSFEGSRWLIHAIFRWYKILSPTIELSVNSVAFDETSLLLYVSITQTFSIFFIPFYSAPVSLTTVLQLVRKSPSRRYYIQSQSDLYQTDQFVRFFAPWGIGATIVLLWHFWATFACVLGAYVGQPFTRWMQRRAEKRIQAGPNGVGTAGNSGQYVKITKQLGEGNSTGGDRQLPSTRIVKVN